MMTASTDHGKDIEAKAGHIPSPKLVEDVFGDESNHDIQYKTLSWQVSNSIDWHCLVLEL